MALKSPFAHEMAVMWIRTIFALEAKSARANEQITASVLNLGTKKGVRQNELSRLSAF